MDCWCGLFQCPSDQLTWLVQNTEEDAHAQLSYAFNDCGLNFMDTAEIYPVPPRYGMQYHLHVRPIVSMTSTQRLISLCCRLVCSAETAGRTDQYICSWLKHQKRENIVLATKVAGYGNKYLRKNGEQTRITAEQVEESVEGSLRRLNTDYIDLLQVKEFACQHSHRKRQ